MDAALKMPRTTWNVVHADKDGNIISDETFHNMIFDAAINDVLAVYFKKTAQAAGWYVGLVNPNPTFAPGDTMQSHPGWTEFTNYQAGGRPAFQIGAIANKQGDNSNNKIVFTISGVGGTVAGGFLCSDAVKGGQTGMLYAAALFPNGVKNVQASDTITVTVTVSGA